MVPVLVLQQLVDVPRVKVVGVVWNVLWVTILPVIILPAVVVSVSLSISSPIPPPAVLLFATAVGRSGYSVENFRLAGGIDISGQTGVFEAYLWNRKKDV